MESKNYNKIIEKEIKKGILIKCKKCSLIYLKNYDNKKCPHKSL
jgi:hypothetical protein